VPDEVVINIQGTNSGTISFNHSLYKAVDEPAGSTFVATIENTDPGFKSINVNSFSEALSVYNFHLDSASVCVNAGSATPFLLDLDDNNRVFGTSTDIGCYERQQ